MTTKRIHALALAAVLGGIFDRKYMCASSLIIIIITSCYYFLQGIEPEGAKS